MARRSVQYNWRLFRAIRLPPITFGVLLVAASSCAQTMINKGTTVSRPNASPDEIYQARRSWTEKAYPKPIYYNRLPKGGRLAAGEQPELFTDELRAAFRSLR
jgi:hypothetical protein